MTVAEKKTDVWMPLWIGAYLADTMHLTTLQHGAYFLLLVAYWRERSALPDDDDQLRSITKLERPEWRKQRPVLAKFFKVDAGLWWHKRVEKEILAADARAKKASEKAEKAAKARWGDGSKQPIGDAPSMPQALPDDVLDECPTPSPIPHPSDASEAKASAGKPAVVDGKRELYEAGKSLLHEQGLPKSQCGSFITKLATDYGQDIALEAVRSAVAAQPLEAREYLKATCMRLKGERGADHGKPITVPSKAVEQTLAYIAAHTQTPEQEAAAAAARAEFLAKHKATKAEGAQA